MKRSDFSYRPDIDGLRAISALAIFFFHLGFSGFSGGFVGVDIFFVISGYLIIPRLVADLREGRFSLSNFYERRIRRILPALLSVLLFSTAVGFFLLGPREYAEFAASGLAALAFGANIFFNDRSDYFADAAHQKPLLHTWSLGVEEQFYIIIPLLLVGLWLRRRQSPEKLIVLITLASFIYNLIFIRINETHTFYLPMSRFWELGLGGVIALYLPRINVGRHFARTAAVLGFALLFWAIFAVDDSAAYPGVVALLPVLGAALVIAAGQIESNWISRALGCGPLRYVGRLSYSLYLIHWPLIVFTRLYLSRPLELPEQLLILLFSFVWAALSWHLLESKVLSKQLMSFRTVVTGLAVTIFVSVGAAGFIVNKDGLSSRMSETSLAVMNDIEQNKSSRVDRCETRVTLGGPQFFKFPVCEYGPENGTKILIWGDSHAGMISDAFHRLVEGVPYRMSGVGMPACSPLVSVLTTRRKNREICVQFVDLVVKHIEDSQIDTVVLAGRWANLASSVRSPGDGGRSHTIFDLNDENKAVSFEFALLRTVEKIKAAGAKVVVVGPVPEIPFNVPDTLIRTYSGIGSLPEVSRAEFNVRQSLVLAALDAVQLSNLAKVIYPHDDLCDENSCEVERDSRSLYTDDDHLSIEGARGIVNSLLPLFENDQTVIPAQAGIQGGI